MPLTNPQTEKPRRSLLFTPANQPRLFRKALASGADIVCVDLEDAVPADQKDTAREQAISFLKESGSAGPQRAVRINPVSSKNGLEDLVAVVGCAPEHGMVMMPKIASAVEAQVVDSVLTEAGSGAHLAALIETLDGLEHVAEIASATPRLKLVVFGAIDFCAELGTQNMDEPLRYARSKIVHAAKRAGLDAMDTPDLSYRDVTGIANAACRAQELGFTGKAAIHPAGIGVINEAFTPTMDEIAHAKRVIAAFHASGNGLATMDGRLIEAPVVKAMQRRLAIASTCGLL